jgi:hypothetical protein
MAAQTFYQVQGTDVDWGSDPHDAFTSDFIGRAFTTEKVAEQEIERLKKVNHNLQSLKVAPIVVYETLEEQAEMIEAAKAKLTPAERRALGIG